MAKSKTGGTRAYIRGRIGSDVYSIGKTATGARQQVVRSLAETVSNPQTTAQMRGRMIMSTVMQAQSALKPIIDHSFDNVQGVQPNLSEFISRNYQLIKADVAAHSSEGNEFGIVKYQEKGIKRGAYVISNGTANIPAALALATETGVATIVLTADDMTVAGLKSKLGMTSSDFFTVVGISATKGAVYARLRVSPNAADDTALTAESIAQVFAVEGNVIPAIALDGNNVTITMADAAGNCGIIVSYATNGGYIHNSCQLSVPATPVWAANVALPTYPVGEQKFLNGGDLFGLEEEDGSEGFNPPVVISGEITGISIDGVAIDKNAAKVYDTNTQRQVLISLANLQSSRSYSIHKQTFMEKGSVGSLVLSDVSGSSVTLSGQTFNANGTVYQLVSDNTLLSEWGNVVFDDGGD